ncbi:hypothetical protein G6F62_012951 [Rhizopus arrhizus]|nr:hypothetical protein G6F62_012951 [Rhizopus arrhizus]
MDEASTIYSNVSRESLTYNGEEYDHLRDVVNAQLEDLKEQMNLRMCSLPLGEMVGTRRIAEDVRIEKEEQKEERQLLNSGESKLSGSLYGR